MILMDPIVKFILKNFVIVKLRDIHAQKVTFNKTQTIQAN